MRVLNVDQFNQLITEASVKPRLRRELRFTNSTSEMTDEDWLNAELLNITDRTGNKGVLLLSPHDELFALPYELSKSLTNKQTGRAQPIICDFCRTWQTGSNAGSISFQKDRQSINSVTFLCCADLACSKHVRSKTNASRLSRAQLREDLTDEQRIERLKNRLSKIIDDLQIKPLSIQ